MEDPPANVSSLAGYLQQVQAVYALRFGGYHIMILLRNLCYRACDSSQQRTYLSSCITLLCTDGCRHNGSIALKKKKNNIVLVACNIFSET